MWSELTYFNKQIRGVRNTKKADQNNVSSKNIPCSTKYQLVHKLTEKVNVTCSRAELRNADVRT
jgi:hypothetical protein